MTDPSPELVEKYMPTAAEWLYRPLSLYEYRVSDRSVAILIATEVSKAVAKERERLREPTEAQFDRGAGLVL